jgi:hypothetical protein
MTDEDRVELAHLLAIPEPLDPTGYVIPDSYDHYRAAIDRAEGRPPRVVPQEHPWD